MKGRPSAREEDPMSPQPIHSSVSPLRRRMLEDMAMRGLREETQRDYIRFVRIFAALLWRPAETGARHEDGGAVVAPKVLAVRRLWWRQGRRRHVLLPHAWLFRGRRAGERTAPRQLNRAVHEAAEAAGIKKRVTPHTLRHSFATHLLEQDVDIRVIQVLLGHSKLDTTALYARVATKTIRAVTSPLEHLKLLVEGAGPGA